MRTVSLIALFLLCACQPALNSQPRYSSLASSKLFPDGAAARPVPEGTRPFAALSQADHASPFARLERGRASYEVNCVACHGLTGEGGLVTIRGFGAVPSLSSDHARHLRDSEVSLIVRHGQGAMFGFGDRLNEREITDIALFLRALQLSQYARFADLPLSDRIALARSPL